MRLKLVYTIRCQYPAKRSVYLKMTLFRNKEFMATKNKITKVKNTAKAWESGELGREIKYAIAVDKKIGTQIDDALGLQMISIRLEKDLIESYKLLGTKYDLGYQPLMREALKRFVEGEFKLIANEALEKQKAAKPKVQTIRRVRKVA